MEVKLWVPFLPAFGDVQVFLPTSRVVDMTSLVLLVVFWTNFYILPRKVDTLQCYECSDFPREPDSQVKKLSPPPKKSELFFQVTIKSSKAWRKLKEIIFKCYLNILG